MRKLILKTVNINSYGSSKNWVGFIERNKNFTISRMNKIINYFINYFKNDLSDVIIATSYFIERNAKQKLDRSTRKVLLPIEIELIRIGVIEEVKEDYLDYYNDDVFDKQIYELETSFREIKKPDKNLLVKLSMLGMADDNLNNAGHCFFIFKKLNLIVYPHGDNTGYGFIGIDSKNNESAIKFLKEAQSIPFLNSHIADAFF